MPRINLDIAGYPRAIVFDLEGEDYTNLQKFPGDTDEQRCLKALWLARDFELKNGNRSLLDPADDEAATLKKLPGKTNREKVRRAIDVGVSIRDRAVEMLAGMKKAMKERDPEARRQRIDKVLQARKGLWVPK